MYIHIIPMICRSDSLYVCCHFLQTTIFVLPGPLSQISLKQWYSHSKLLFSSLSISTNQEASSIHQSIHPHFIHPSNPFYIQPTVVMSIINPMSSLGLIQTQWAILKIWLQWTKGRSKTISDFPMFFWPRIGTSILVWPYESSFFILNAFYTI